MSGREKHEITVYLHADTERAWMVNESPLHLGPPTAHVWLPMSQCEEVKRETVYRKLTPDDPFILGTHITLLVPAWLLEKTGLDHLVDA